MIGDAEYENVRGCHPFACLGAVRALSHLVARLHAIVATIKRVRGHTAEQAEIAERSMRITQLETALSGLLNFTTQGVYLVPSEDEAPAIATAKAALHG